MFPEGVSAHVQYGPRIRAAAIYLNAQQLIPEDRVGEVLRDVFAAGLVCPASITSWVGKAAAGMAPFEAHIAGLVATAPVRNLDETGFRIAGKTQWRHTTSTPGMTWYRATAKRGAVSTNLRGGIIVHDHFKSYYALAGVTYGLGNAHHLRELKALIEMEKEEWAKNMTRLLLKLNKAVKRAVEQSQQVLAARLRQRVNALYDVIVSQAIAFHEQQPPLTRKPGARGRPPRRPGHNLAIRLRDFKDDVLRFATDFKVPFTNSLSEQALRMMKVRMKISGGFRIMAGAQIFATLRSVLSTARKQGWNPLIKLATPPPALIYALGA